MVNLAWFCDVLLHFWSGEDAVSPVDEIQILELLWDLFYILYVRLSVGVC